MTCSLGFGFRPAASDTAAGARGGGGAAAAPCGPDSATGLGRRLMRTASSPSLISISEMPDSSSSSMSFLIFRMSMPGLPPRERRGPCASGRRSEPLCGGAHGDLVAKGAEAADHADGDVGEIRVASERLTGMRVGEMHLDERQAGGEDRVPPGDAGGGESARGP